MVEKTRIKQNLHTHSVYCDGNDTVEEMVQEAILKKFTVLGFSGHGKCALDSISMDDQRINAYITDILEMKEKYKNQISIHLGIEQDMAGRLENSSDFEYVIGSKHFINTTPIDYSFEVFTELFESYHKDYVKLCKDYYEDVARMRDWQEVDIIGHLDLITKYNEDESFFKFEDKKYVSIVCDCVDSLLSKNKIFEINTGAIARGYRTTCYPYKNILKYLQEHGARICLNSDCHNRKKLDCAYEQTMELIRDCGFKEMVLLTDNGFEARPISNFTF